MNAKLGEWFVSQGPWSRPDTLEKICKFAFDQIEKLETPPREFLELCIRVADDSVCEKLVTWKNDPDREPAARDRLWRSCSGPTAGRKPKSI